MKVQLSDLVSIPAIEYASQGNAILGIRDSGKSYTATLIAEQLMEAKIPFVAFDPIGVWRYLKVGANGNAGYPVVVAGENADIELTPESAPNIVRAAMRENISLIIDLYSMKLSKADWKKIVQQSVELLLYENKTCGLRHIFIEEAAEFCPQRVGPDQGRVYAEIEKLARMGGNASLGYTLINQRAEEVNKAVLELCDCLILHRQKGRNSLIALGKWLDVADAEGSREIIKSLPTCGQGECWVWLQGSTKPIRTKINEKKTVHPDRRNPLKITKDVTVDVSAFVSRLKKSLEQSVKTGAVVHEVKRVPASVQIISNEELQAEQSKSAKLEIVITGLREELSIANGTIKQFNQTISDLKKLFLPQYQALRRVFEKIEELPEKSFDVSRYEVWLTNPNLPPLSKEILKILISEKHATKQQLLLRLGKKAGGHTDNCFSKLTTAKLIKRVGDEYVLEEII